jgi:uncharacterized protein (TIGR00369 family)
VTRDGITAGERLADMAAADEVRRSGNYIWATLGYRRVAAGPGTSTVEWEAPVDYCFPTTGGPVVQGGMVAAVLDAAMGGACWTVLDRDQAFLTVDIRVEFLRSCRPGVLRAVGEVVRRTRKVVFCSATLYDADGTEIAASRGTQVVLPADGAAGRYATDMMIDQTSQEP